LYIGEIKLNLIQIYVSYILPSITYRKKGTKALIKP